MGRVRTRGLLRGGPPSLRQRPADIVGVVGADDLVWLAVPPAAGLVMAATIWLAPLLARLVRPAPSWKPFPAAVQAGLIRPEPVEQTRFLVAATAPFVVIALWLALRRWHRWRLRSSLLATGYVVAVQVVIAAVVAACWVSQRSAHEWFADKTLLVGAGLGAGLLALAWKGWIVPKSIVGAAGRGRRLVGLGIATLFTAVWLLPAVYRTPTATLIPARLGVLFQIQFVQDEFASVLNGRTPMVDFGAQYAKLLPFLVAPVLAVLGPSVGVTTGVLAGLGLLGLIAVYGTFVVLTEDPVSALVLYIPFLALSLFTLTYIGAERINLATLAGVIPIRVLGPFVLGWLCSRQLRKGSDRARIALFMAAGLVAINNTEYGAASFVALGLALWCGHDGRSSGWGRARRLSAQAVAGAVLSGVAVCALTLLRSRSLPNLANLSNVTRVFAVEGFGMEPIQPTLGLHIIIYLTFVVALAMGVMGAVGSDDASPQARVLRGLLAYSGLLGLGAGTYWVGRSDPLALFGMFPTWGLSLAVLCWALLRQAAARPTMAPATVARWALPAAGILLAFGLMMTVVVQIPSPAAQLRRLTAEGPEIPQYAERVRFIAGRTTRGEPVAILASAGHLLARDAGVQDVSPYASEASIVFYEQMDLLLGTMSRSGASKAFVEPTWSEISAYLAQKGYRTFATDEASGLTVWQRALGGPG